MSLNSVLIRDIFAPQQVAAIIRKRELAVQEATKIDQQIVQAKSQAELERQRALAKQNKAKVDAETESIRAKISAEQHSEQDVIGAQAVLSIAKIDLKTAKARAEARIAEAEGERKVVEARTTAEANVLKQEVSAYASDADYVRAKLYGKTAPGLKNVITSDSPGGVFGLPVRSAAKGGAK